MTGTGHPALTTSSMTGSGLAASSCSFTFSSTRGCKTTRQARRRGPVTLRRDTAKAKTVQAGVPGETLGPLVLTSPLAPGQPDVKTLQGQL